MPATAILAIDQGTTNTKALLVGRDGAVLGSASRPVAISHPQPGWTEQSALDLWESVRGVIADIVAAHPDVSVAMLAIANQRETIVAWDATTGDPLAPAVTWQCRRSAPLCARLRDAGREAKVVAATGLGLDPLFPSGKIAWLLDNVPAVAAVRDDGRLRLGTVDAWLLWRLTGGQAHATDASNASRTQLLDIEALRWDPAMLDLFGVPAAALPEVRPSDSLFGATAEGATALPAATPIHAMLGDSHAALLGHGFDRPGMAKVTCGTGSSLMATTAARVHSGHGLASTVAWQQGGTACYALEGNVAVSGHAAGYASRLFGFEDETALTALAASVEGSDGVVFVPALAGLGAPHWDTGARGALSGLSLGTTKAHVARAVLEGIALQIGDVVEAMDADLGVPIESLSVDGGASRNDLLMQMLADVIDRPVIRPDRPEIGALGASRLAAEASGWIEPGGWRARSPDRFLPSLPPERRATLRRTWRDAVSRVSTD